MTRESDLFARFAKSFIGLDRKDPVRTIDADEPSERRRVYLDTTATALMPQVVWDGLHHYLEAASANSHTYAHRAGRDTTQAIEDSRAAVGRLVGYDPEKDVVLFTANGATGAVNFLARAFFPPELRPVIKRFPDGAPPAFVDSLRDALGENGKVAIDELLARPLVVTTKMEHHSNLLPWIEAVGHHNLRVAEVDPDDGTLDLESLETILEGEGHKVRLVAITGVSNVTGIQNPVRKIARLAHQAGAQVMVDGAQWVPHSPVIMHPGDPAECIDFLVFSGHKMYAPGSRGALIGSLKALSARQCVTDVGGGMVDYVSIDDYAVKDEVTAREEAGTPNITGSISMGLVAEVLLKIGMAQIEEDEIRMAKLLVNRLLKAGAIIYGSTDLDAVPRAAVVAFNIPNISHGFVAAYLNDFHNIAVRNECFCAQPYATALLKMDEASKVRYRSEMICGDRSHLPGMVRASLGIYSTEEDIEAIGDALECLQRNVDQILPLYTPDLDGTYRYNDGSSLPRTFDVAAYINAWTDA